MWVFKSPCEEDIKLPLLAHLVQASLLEMIVELSTPMAPWTNNVEPTSITNVKSVLEDGNALCQLAFVFGVSSCQNQNASATSDSPLHIGCTLKRDVGKLKTLAYFSVLHYDSNS